MSDFRADRSLIEAAIKLNMDRLPADEIYDREFTVDLIRRHLAEQFGPNWKIHLVVATYEQRCVGMLMGYEDVGNALIFVSFLAAQSPRRLDVSQKLTDALFAERHNMGLHTSPRFLFEVDDPARGQIPKERRHRLARLKVFDRIAPFENLHLRGLDIPYLQPKMEWPSQTPEKRLLLCYAAPGLDRDMPRS